MKSLLWLVAAVTWSASTIMIALGRGEVAWFVAAVLTNVLGGRVFVELYDWGQRGKVDADQVEQIVEMARRAERALTGAREASR